MADKEQSKKQTDQATQDRGYQQDQQSQHPTGQTDQGKQDQGQQSQQGQDPTQGAPIQTDQTGKPEEDSSRKPDDPGQQPPAKICIKDNEIKDILDDEKWEIQRDKIESQCDQKLKECLIGNSDLLLKIYKDITDTVEKYRQECEGIKNKLNCIKKANQAALSDIPINVNTEIESIIEKAFQKISSLKACKEELECLVDKNGECDDINYQPAEKKPKLPLDCKDGNIEGIKTLKQATDELQGSKKYHDSKEKSFNHLKGMLANLQDTIKKIEDYQQKAEKACKEGKKCIQYTYILIIQRILGSTEFYSADELEAELKTLLDDLRKAKTDRCFKEYVKAKVEATISLISQAIEEKEKNRDETILERIVSTPI